MCGRRGFSQPRNQVPLAAGAMLTMIARTMLPDVCFKGNSITGLVALMGFLAALVFKSLPLRFSTAQLRVAEPLDENGKSVQNTNLVSLDIRVIDR